MNPEPWTRSLIWLAIAGFIIVSVVKDQPIKISAGGFDIERGGPTQVLVNGGLTNAFDKEGTHFTSVCPPKTRAIGGNCTEIGNNIPLQNFGSVQNDDGRWRFECVWVGRVKAEVHAICLRSN